jgi:hypothetical protein
VGRDELEKTLIPTVGPEIKNSMLTYGQKLEKQGLDRGIDLGRKEGIDLGRKDVLMRQLTRRFGTLSTAVTQRINAASTAELERWTERILDADSLDAVFGPHSAGTLRKS